MRHINYKSDFAVRETIKDGKGQVISLTNCDVTITYRTNKFKKYVASIKSGLFTNCRIDESGALIVTFDNHNLGQGYLTHEFQFDIIDGAIPDFKEELITADNLNIELWAHESDTTGIVESEILLNYAKGEAFTFEDFTQEQIQMLQKPAVDAAQSANTAATAANTATTKATEATASALSATDSANSAAERAGTATAEATTATKAANIAASNADSKAIKANNAAIFAGEKATFADEKATEAGNAADRAIETAGHPTYVGNDQYVYKWDSAIKKYVKTDIYVKGDSGVHTGNSPTEYDDVWIDPEGDAATAQHILADNGKSVQENLDEADKKMFQLLTNKADTTYVNASIQSAILDSWEGSY